LDIGSNIKKARMAAGITQKELAERMEVTQKDISRWENNSRGITASSLAKLCKELGVSADEILELK